MKTRRMLQIKKVQEEEKKEKYLTTGRVLKVQIEEERKKHSPKIPNPAVKTEGQRGILRKKIRTNITKVKPKERLDPEARAKAKRYQKVKKETQNTVNMKIKKCDQEAEKKTKKNIMTFIAENEAKARRRIKGEDLEVMARIIPKVKTGENMNTQKAGNVSSLKTNIVPIIRPESEAEVWTEANEPGPEVKNETAAEVKIIPNIEIRK